MVAADSAPARGWRGGGGALRGWEEVRIQPTPVSRKGRKLWNSCRSPSGAASGREGGGGALKPFLPPASLLSSGSAPPQLPGASVPPPPHRSGAWQCCLPSGPPHSWNNWSYSKTLGTNELMCPPPQSQRHWFSLSPRVVLSVGPPSSMAFLEGELDCTAGEALPLPTFQPPTYEAWLC